MSVLKLKVLIHGKLIPIPPRGANGDLSKLRTAGLWGLDPFPDTATSSAWGGFIFFFDCNLWYSLQGVPFPSLTG